MEITEIKSVTTKKKVTIGHKCDICGKIHIGGIPDDWHRFSGSHSEWCNDSCESVEYYTVCSPECYKEALRVALVNFGEYDSSEIDGFDLRFAKAISAFLNKP